MKFRVPFLILMVVPLSGCVAPTEGPYTFGAPEPGSLWIYSGGGTEVTVQHRGDGSVISPEGAAVAARIIDVNIRSGEDGYHERLFVSLDWRDVIMAITPCGEVDTMAATDRCVLWFPPDTGWFFGVSTLWGRSFDDLPSGIARDPNGAIYGDWNATVDGPAVAVKSVVSTAPGYGSFRFDSWGYEFELKAGEAVPLRVHDIRRGAEDAFVLTQMQRHDVPSGRECAPPQNLDVPSAGPASIPQERDASYLPFPFGEAWDALGDRVGDEDTLVAARFVVDRWTRALGDVDIYWQATWKFDVWSREAGGRSYAIERERYGSADPTTATSVEDGAYAGPKLNSVVKPKMYVHLDEAYRLAGNLSTTRDSLDLRPVEASSELLWTKVMVPLGDAFFSSYLGIHAYEGTLVSWEAAEEDTKRLYTECF